MAYALICGINPLYGVIGIIIPTIIAAVFGNSNFLVSGFTNAVAMASAGVLTGYSGQGSDLQVVLAIAVVSGFFKLALGLFRLGWLTRFISNSVLTGFLLGLGLLIILNQINALTGLPRNPAISPIFNFVDHLTHLNEIKIVVFSLGLGSIFLLILLRRYFRKLPGEMLVVVLSSIFVYLFNLDQHGVRLVADLGEMPQLGIHLFDPSNLLPEWRYFLRAGAAVAVLSIMEALTVSKSVALSRGERLNINQELIGQGLASIIGGVFQSPPASGSPSRTAVNIGAGARSRFAAIFSGLWVIPVVVVFPKWLGYIPLPVLAAVVITSAVRIVNWQHVFLTWHSKGTSRLVLLVTFIATLIFPLADAIFLGAGLSVLFYLYESSQLRLTYFEMDENRRFYQSDAFTWLRPNLPVVLLSPEGSLHFAAVDSLETHIQNALESGAEVVIIRLRRAQVIASSAIVMLTAEIRHAEKLGKKILLCGIGEELHARLQESGVLDLLGEDASFDTQRLLYAATRSAVDRAEQLVKCKNM